MQNSTTYHCPGTRIYVLYVHKIGWWLPGGINDVRSLEIVDWCCSLTCSKLSTHRSYPLPSSLIEAVCPAAALPTIHVLQPLLPCPLPQRLGPPLPWLSAAWARRNCGHQVRPLLSTVWFNSCCRVCNQVPFSAGDVLLREPIDAVVLSLNWLCRYFNDCLHFSPSALLYRLWFSVACQRSCHSDGQDVIVKAVQAMIHDSISIVSSRWEGS